MLMKETTFSSIYYSCERSNLWHASLKPASVGVFFRYVDLLTARSRRFAGRAGAQLLVAGALALSLSAVLSDTTVCNKWHCG